MLWIVLSYLAIGAVLTLLSIPAPVMRFGVATRPAISVKNFVFLILFWPLAAIAAIG